MTKFPICLSPTVHFLHILILYFYTYTLHIHRSLCEPMLWYTLVKLVVSCNFFIHKNFLNCFYLLIFYFEKHSNWFWRLPFAVRSFKNSPLWQGHARNVSCRRFRVRIHCWDLGTTCQMRHETLDRDVTHGQLCQRHNDGGCLYNVGCWFRKKDQFSSPNFILINRANTLWRLLFGILFVQSVGWLIAGSSFHRVHLFDGSLFWLSNPR